MLVAVTRTDVIDMTPKRGSPLADETLALQLRTLEQALIADALESQGRIWSTPDGAFDLVYRALAGITVAVQD